mgnify:FL=1|tara:strand:+ start:528 stop:956 length:429 start_codon:yes stop_codon:yes gene_type:complete
MEKYIVKAKCLFSHYTEVHVVDAKSQDDVLAKFKKLQAHIGINIETKYSDKIEVLHVDDVENKTMFFRDIRMANASVTAKQNFGESFDDDDCGNPKDKHFITVSEAMTLLSKDEWNDIFHPPKEVVKEAEDIYSEDEDYVPF